MRSRGDARAEVVPLEVSTGHVSDGTLVTHYRAGDEHAIERLYRRHAPKLVAMAERLVGQSGEADDAVHDGFVRALAQLPRLREPERFGHWLRRIVVNECRQRLRRRGRWHLFRRDESPEQLFDGLASRCGDPEHAAEIRRIGTLLRAVAPDERLAWSLRFIEGCSLEEGADLAGCSLATFKRRLARAVARLGELTMEGK
jgi:RNA polymerase sigma-70 factor (ECF subfamily)